MQVIKFIFYSCLGASLFLGSCSPGELSPGEYIRWVRDYSNGIHKKKKTDVFSFDIQYKPVEYIAVIETSASKNDTAFYNSRLKELQGMDYFDLRISSDHGDIVKEGARSSNDFYQRLYYFSFNFQNQISLEQGGKLLPCQLFHLEQGYDLAKERRFLLGFEKTNEVPGDKTLVIDCMDLGIGIIKVTFEKKDLKNIPLLRI